MNERSLLDQDFLEQREKMALMTKELEYMRSLFKAEKNKRQSLESTKTKQILLRELV